MDTSPSNAEEGSQLVNETDNRNEPSEDQDSKDLRVDDSLNPSLVAVSQSDHSNKITVVLCPVGGAPILKTRKWEVDCTKTVQFILTFIRKKLSLPKSDSLFVYVNQSFAPAPDQSVQNLFDCFGSDGKLILAYCKTHAWG